MESASALASGVIKANARKVAKRQITFARRDIRTSRVRGIGGSGGSIRKKRLWVKSKFWSEGHGDGHRKYSSRSDSGPSGVRVYWLKGTIPSAIVDRDRKSTRLTS